MKSTSKIIIFLATSLFVACASQKKTETATTTAAMPNTDVKAVEQSAPKTESTKALKKSMRTEKKSIVKSETSNEVAASSELNCTSAKDTRKLAIVTKNTGCELQYTKASETKTIASQIVGDTKCKEVMNTVKEKLAAARFECK